MVAGGWRSVTGDIIPVVTRAFRVALTAAIACTAWGAAPDGLWRSDGYGSLIEIAGPDLRGYEITSISCLPSLHARRQSESAGEIVFAADDGLFRFRPGASPRAARLHVDGAVSDIVLHRLDMKPKVCDRAPEDTPPSNYAIFWQTFAENYAFFDLRHVDWQAVDRKFRPQVTAATKPAELFAILQQMIEPLADAHTSIDAPRLKTYHGFRQDPNHFTPDDWAQADHLIASHCLRGEMQSYCKGHVQFGMLDAEIGYLRVNSFHSYASGGYAAQLHALETALDAGFRDTQKWRGLVIDVRRNSGGDDPLGIEIASRLTSAKYLAYSKVTRDNIDGPLHFTEPQETWVTPASRPGYRGPVVLLTGPDTISAGETFTMALMGRRPQVTRIGQNTQGVFSDVLARSLPNGWRFGLPNEVYLTRDGKAFDGPGVPPDVRLLFVKPGEAAGKDAVLDKALEILKR